MKTTTAQPKGSPASDLFGGWRPMRAAPRDGTEIECLVYHRNRRYAKKSEKHEWTDIVKAHWTDHNGGGWVWMGMMGQFRGWRPNDSMSAPRDPNFKTDAPALMEFGAAHGSAFRLPHNFHISETPEDLALRALDSNFRVEARQIGISPERLLAMLIRALPNVSDQATASARRG